MTGERYWRLTIEKMNGSTTSIFGTEEVLQGTIDEWIEYMDTNHDVETDDRCRVITVDGFTDTADRTQYRAYFVAGTVIGMSIVEM